VITIAALALAAAPAAQAKPGVTVSSVSSLKAGAYSGTLTGSVYNDTGRSARAQVTVRIMKRGLKKTVVGRTAVNVGAASGANYRVKVKLPRSLARGNYYLSACTPTQTGKGLLGCATAHDDVLIKGGFAIRGSGAALAPSKATASQAQCSAGGRTLSQPGMRVYPETGNTGYQSVHSDVYISYDAPSNQFLPGTHVDMQQRSTQCLTELSVDFERTNGVTSMTTPGPNFTVSSVAINGQPATFEFKQPTYPGDPNGQDDPDPLAHRSGLTIPINAANPNPPACTSTGTSAALQNQPCPANKLVITPSAPIPSGTNYTVTVNYTGRPGVHMDGDGSTEGWFRNNNPVGDGGFVTTEPVGTMAWMPLNNHPSAKPTYDFYDTVNYDPTPNAANRVAIGNGRLVSTTVNPADANFATGSRTFHWKSPEPIANYLVENSMGFYDLASKDTASGVMYYWAQASAISQTQKNTNQPIIDQQESITHFQELFNGPFPFSSDGVIIGIPNASFEEEMQTKITFAGGSISLGTFHHENMHQWWGDNVSEGAYNLTFFKEGQANMSQDLNNAWTQAKNNGGLGTTAGDAAFEASLVNAFNNFYNGTSTSPWAAAPSNPTSSSLFTTATTYTRPGKSYIALRAILGKDRYASALQDIQRTYGGGSVTEAQVVAAYKKWLPNQSIGCRNKLDAFFKQWWDTAYSGSPAAGNKAQITGPGLAGPGFYDANGGCSDYGNDQPSTPGGTVPATLSLTLGAPATFAPFIAGVGQDYTSSTTATIVSSAGDATLSVADPSTNAPGHLVNGAFSLPTALKAAATSAAGTSAGAGSVNGSPLTLETWNGPTSNDVATLTFTQTIGANDALRTGSYSKTLTFTLSTTNP
jgi:hypothetical protein